MQGEGNECVVLSLGLGKVEASFLSLYPHASPQGFLLPQSQQTKYSFCFSFSDRKRRFSTWEQNMHKTGMIVSSLLFQRIDCATLATPYRIMDSQPQEWEACDMTHTFYKSHISQLIAVLCHGEPSRYLHAGRLQFEPELTIVSLLFFVTRSYHPLSSTLFCRD